MKKVFSRWKRSIFKNSKNQIVIFNKDAESMAEVMGIDLARFSILEQICIISRHESTCKVSCFQKIIAQCENTNEIVLVIYLFDKIIERYYEHVRMANLN
jgi:hypothetical protein